jgi:hypothetical protein
MSAEQALFDAYREWLRLAKAARKAIGKRDWNFLLECQSARRKFQPLISGLTQAARREWKQPEVDCATKEKKLHAAVSELIALLELNQKRLRDVRAAAQSKREQLAQAGRNLKRLQQAYLLARRPAWTSFS